MTSNSTTQSSAEQVMLRRQMLAQSICVPSNSETPVYPFMETGYPHKQLIGSLLGEPWSTISKAAPNSLIPLDPFEPSLYRNGLKIWDAAVGIPASTIRPDTVLHTRRLPAYRNCNTTWLNQTTHALGRVGNVLGDGNILRPHGAFILDLMNSPDGWKLLEGAHALAHRVGETRPRETKARMFDVGRTYFHTQRFLFQLYVCRTYGLPMDVLCLDEGRPGAPDVEQYGIEIKSSSYFRTPILRVPCVNREAPRPDETIAFITGGVYLEPHPYGFTKETNVWKEVNRWSCQPTILVIAGWELVDVVSHQALCCSNPDDPLSPRCYGMQPSDLMPADEFGAYMYYAKKHRGEPIVDNKRYWMVDDWLNSTDYERAVRCSPPLPCRDCLRLNMLHEGAPHKPLCRPPETQRTKQELAAIREGTLRIGQNEREWLEWAEKLGAIEGIIRKAVEYYEGRVYGFAAAKRIRAARLSNYRHRLEVLKGIHALHSKIARAYRNGNPSQAEALKVELSALVKQDAERN